MRRPHAITGRSSNLIGSFHTDPPKVILGSTEKGVACSRLISRDAARKEADSAARLVILSILCVLLPPNFEGMCALPEVHVCFKGCVLFFHNMAVEWHPFYNVR